MRAAALLINSLSPAHRAVLYTALNAFEVLHEECLEDVQERNYNPLLTAHIAGAHEYAITNTKQIKRELFAECFPEDLKLEKHIHINFKNSKKAVVSLD